MTLARRFLNEYKTVEGTDYALNPQSKAQIVNILGLPNSDSRYHEEYRWLVDEEKGLYVWRAYELTHDSFAQEIGIPFHTRKGPTMFFEIPHGTVRLLDNQAWDDTMFLHGDFNRFGTDLVWVWSGDTGIPSGVKQDMSRIGDYVFVS